MRILLTGASSFTGAWFAKTLARAGHDVTATFTQSQNSYTGLRRERIEIFFGNCTCIWNAPFGSQIFLRLIDKEFDVLCHHGSCVKNYKSDDFDYISALTDNTHGVRESLEGFVAKGLKRVVLTGSVFEADEGTGEYPLRAFSPYGLSKSLTASVFRFWCERVGVSFGKFIIPNPFGPYEDLRFTNYLISTWSKGEIALVQSPAYVRDNIPVSLLAKAYAHFVVGEKPHLHPSCYVETQGDFAQRFAGEIRKRLGISCEINSQKQTVFTEPKTRINTDLAFSGLCDWDETKAWDELAAYYRSKIYP